MSGLLEKMAQAVRLLSYEGTLVYLHENRLDALSLVHRVEKGEIQERLISLSGPIQATARQHDRVMCVMPNGHPISVEPEQGAGFLNAGGIDPSALGAHYRIEELGSARVAGRDTDVIGIIPRDGLRYGYQFHIDRETALPLKSDLIDADREPLEQLMFTSLDLKPSDGVPPREESTPMRSAPEATSSGGWRFQDPPEGFALVMGHSLKQRDGSELEHYLFTDRLSSYSIYIEQGDQEGLEGEASIGAVHAVGRRIQGHQVTVVGEVPLVTVRQAIAGVQRMSGSHD
ncbi:MucB/RseB C-terminal domain-containing protein [Imhoffiella purpurea]|uniref:MucB/RseB C-terminal domain-containing protein n=1 Tax=Imhoffiella purpurea TaxID=1249627 RepID=UPI001E35973A|nr:MucB/RseB C-terminal domain-containing protein [Imhoffiella purpurea]